MTAIRTYWDSLAVVTTWAGWAAIACIMASMFGACGCAAVDRVNAAVVSGMAAASAAEPYLLLGYQKAQEDCLRRPREEIDPCLDATREDFAVIVAAYEQAERTACALAPEACVEPAK